jgi:uncharacterized membrane protein YhaH (DUF805 family)
MVDSSTQFYFLDASHNQQGPASVTDLSGLVRSGAVTRATMIWFNGMADWRPAGQVNELAPLFGPPAAAPPMRPPMPAAAPAMRAPAQAASFGGYDPHSPAGYPAKSVGFMDAIRICLGKYVDFNGRASRPEFWFWALFQFCLLMIIVVVGGIISAILPTVGSVIMILGYLVVVFGLLLPSLAVSVRRLHDTDRSGWWVLIALVPFGNIVQLVFMCLPGTPGPNRFG